MICTPFAARFIVTDRLIGAFAKKGSKSCGKNTRALVKALTASDPHSSSLRDNLPEVAALEAGLLKAVKVRCAGCPALCKDRVT